MIQRALTLVGKHHMEWETYELPRLKDHEVMIQTIATSISIGAELPQFDASDLTDLVPTYPRKVGYESFGRVLKIGRKVSSLNIGDKVLAFYGQKDLAVVKESDVFLSRRILITKRHC